MSENEKRSEIEILNKSLPGDKSLRIRRDGSFYSKRELNINQIFGLCYPKMGASIYFTLGIIAIHSLGATPFVFILALGFLLLTAMSYAEATSSFPNGEGAAGFSRHAFNELVSVLASWCQVLGNITALAIACYSAINYISFIDFFSLAREYPHNLFFSAGLIFIIINLNILGHKYYTVLAPFFSVVDIIFQSLLMIIGALFFLNMPQLLNRIHIGVIPTIPEIINGTSLIMITFFGMEGLSQLSEQAKSPGRTIPTAIWWSTALSFFTFFGISSVALSCMPVEYRITGYVYYEETTARMVGSSLPINRDSSPAVQNATVLLGNIATTTDEKGYFFINTTQFGENSLIIKKSGISAQKFPFNNAQQESSPSFPFNAEWTTDLKQSWVSTPLLGIADKLPILREPMMMTVSIMAFIIMIFGANLSISGIMKTIPRMEMYRQIPSLIAQPHNMYKSPYRALMLVMVVAILILLLNDLQKMAQVFALPTIILFFITHISVIALRIKNKNLRRPYKIPMNIRIQDKPIPLPALMGMLSSLILGIMVIITSPYCRWISIPFLLVGILLYIIYRSLKKLPITPTYNYSARNGSNNLENKISK